MDKTYFLNDFSLEKIIIDYQDIIITIYNPYFEQSENIQCKNFIGINYVGQWDENVIEKIEITSQTSKIALLKEQIARNSNPHLSGGGRRRFDGTWMELIVYLIDGVNIDVVCQEIILPLSFRSNS